MRNYFADEIRTKRIGLIFTGMFLTTNSATPSLTRVISNLVGSVSPSSLDSKLSAAPMTRVFEIGDGFEDLSDGSGSTRFPSASV